MSMFWEALAAGDFDYLLQWMKNNWTLSVYISLAYVIIIFWGQVRRALIFIENLKYFKRFERVSCH